MNAVRLQALHKFVFWSGTLKLELFSVLNTNHTGKKNKFSFHWVKKQELILLTGILLPNNMVNYVFCKTIRDTDLDKIASHIFGLAKDTQENFRADIFLHV